MLMKADEIAKEIKSMLKVRKEYGDIPLGEQDVTVNSREVAIMLWGCELVLNEDGTWYFYDTSGG